MDLNSWTEKCAYRLYECQKNAGEQTSPDHNWKWAEELAKQNTIRINGSHEWGEEDEAIVHRAITIHRHERGIRLMNHAVQQMRSKSANAGIRI